VSLNETTYKDSLIEFHVDVEESIIYAKAQHNGNIVVAHGSTIEECRENITEAIDDCEGLE